MFIYHVYIIFYMNLHTNIDKAIVEGINFNLNAANEKINEIISLKLA